MQTTEHSTKVKIVGALMDEVESFKSDRGSNRHHNPDIIDRLDNTGEWESTLGQALYTIFESSDYFTRMTQELHPDGPTLGQYIFEKHGFSLIPLEAYMGHEGGGEDTEAVIAIVPHTLLLEPGRFNSLTIQQIASILAGPENFVIRYEGTYGSYSGTTWNDSGLLVTPQVLPTMTYVQRGA